MEVLETVSSHLKQSSNLFLVKSKLKREQEIDLESVFLNRLVLAVLLTGYGQN